MPCLLQAGRTVNGCRLVKRWIDGRNSRHVDDCVPAHLLPVVRQIQKRSEQRNARQEVDPCTAQIADDRVDQAAIGKEVGQNGRNDNPTEEMRKRVDRLINTFELRSPHFIDEQRKKNRRRELKDQSGNVDFKRIADRFHGGGRFEDPGKVIHAHPLGTPDAKARIVFLECQNDAAHRAIMEDGEKHDAWNQHQINIASFPYRMTKPLEFCLHLFSPFM